MIKYDSTMVLIFLFHPLGIFILLQMCERWNFSLRHIFAILHSADATSIACITKQLYTAKRHLHVYLQTYITCIPLIIAFLQIWFFIFSSVDEYATFGLCVPCNIPKLELQNLLAMPSSNIEFKDILEICVRPCSQIL